MSKSIYFKCGLSKYALIFESTLLSLFDLDPLPLSISIVSKMKLEVLVSYPISAKLLILIISGVSTGSLVKI